MTMLICLIVTGILYIIGCIGIIKNKNKVKKLISSIFLIPFLSMLFISFIGLQKGCQIQSLTIYNPIQFYRRASVMPYSDTSKISNDVSGCILIFYRFECPDCASVMNELSEKIADTDNLYFIPSRSKKGISLRERFPIKSVPVGVYVYHDNETFIAKNLDTPQKELDEKNLERLLYLQQNQR